MGIKMNKIVLWFVKRKAYEIGKQYREGKLNEKYSWSKGIEKFLMGAGMVITGTLVAGYLEKDPKVVVPVFVALGQSLWSAIRFFVNRKRSVKANV